MQVSSPVAESYRARRARAWEAFASGSEPLTDYWSAWAERSHGWRTPIEFLQPVGLEAPDAFDALEPLLAELRAMPEVEVFPTSWLHLTWVRLGFLMATDLMWSQVETFYVNASPRLHRVHPFSLRLGGISVADDERITLGVDDGGSYREARRQAKLGVPRVYEVLRDDPGINGDIDSYMPAIDIAAFTGAAVTGRDSRERVREVLEPYRELDLGEVPVTHLKLARLPIQPHDYYAGIDVIAEIPMYGDAYRRGYHN